MAKPMTILLTLFALGAAVNLPASAADAVDEGGQHAGGVGEVAAGELPVDGDGAHAFDGDLDVVDGVEEDGILVDLAALDPDETLADGLDEADTRIQGLEGGEEPEAGGGLALVHAGAGHEDALGRGVGRLGEETFGCFLVTFGHGVGGHRMDCGIRNG